MSDLPSEVPIFALGTVLFPGGVLPLRIFEPRYLDMIKRCMANGTPFGVCSIKQGREVGQAAGIRDYGTLAHITDFDLLEDGLLGIEARGGERFEVISSEVRDDQLIHAQIGPFQREEPADIPEELHHSGIRKTDGGQRAVLFCQRFGLERRSVTCWRCHQIAFEIHPIRLLNGSLVDLVDRQGLRNAEVSIE